MLVYLVGHLVFLPLPDVERLSIFVHVLQFFPTEFEFLVFRFPQLFLNFVVYFIHGLAVNHHFHHLPLQVHK